MAVDSATVFRLNNYRWEHTCNSLIRSSQNQSGRCPPCPSRWGPEGNLVPEWLWAPWSFAASVHPLHILQWGEKIITLIPFRSLFYYISRAVFMYAWAYEGTVPAESWWQVWGSLNHGQWFLSFCNILQLRTKRTGQSNINEDEEYVIRTSPGFKPCTRWEAASLDPTVIRYLAHSLHFYVFTVEVLLKFGKFIQVPSLFA